MTTTKKMKELTAKTRQLKLVDCRITTGLRSVAPRVESFVPYKKRTWTKAYEITPSELVYEHFVFPEDVHHPRLAHDLKEKFTERPAKVIRAFLLEEIIPMEHCHWLQAPTQAPKPSEHIQANA